MKLFKFYKNNCEPCSKLSEMLSEISVPENVTLVEKSIHEKDNLHLLKENGFKIVPVLMYEDGRSLQGLPSFDQLQNFINNKEV